MNWSEQKVTVTGGAGFLGRVICRKLAERGCRQIDVPRRQDYDLTTEKAVERMYDDFRPDVVIHLAAEVGGIGANQDQPGRFFFANMAMGMHLIEQARVRGLGKFVQTGTVCSYPKHTPVPFREEELWNGYPEETNAPYGVAKKSLYVMLDAYHQQYGLNSAVALPVDEILNEAVNVMERYIGHEPQVVEQLQRILRNARDIKQVIQQVGQQMAPAQAVSQGEVDEDHERLCGRRMLVVDEDENVRSVAHNLLERYGCIVETAHDGNEAMRMVRATNIDGGYDVILADIRLPDMSGYEFLVKLKEVLDHPPLTLMTGFGYDPGHSLVKARQAGCMEVLYKPFRVDQLLETMIRIVTTTDDVTPA